MIAAFLLPLLAQDAPKGETPKIAGAIISLLEPDGSPSRMQIQLEFQPMAKPKLSPKRFGDPPVRWEFPYLAAAYSLTAVPEQQDLRFRLYAQERAEDPARDLSGEVGKMLLRLFDHNYRRLGLDHSLDVSRGVVDVYLCREGDPGGEQRFDLDDTVRPFRRANTIYIYDLPSFQDPLEKAREVAHEYGHASLPPVGGFRTPEDWANGHLGERLFLQYIRDEMRAGRYGAPDAMGAELPAIEGYVKTKVDPLVATATVQGPKLKIAGPGQMDGFMGVALAVHRYLGPRAFIRSLLLTDATKAQTFPEAVGMALQERETWRVDVRPEDVNRTVWLPMGDVRLEGALIVGKSGYWRQVKLVKPVFAVYPRRPE